MHRIALILLLPVGVVALVHDVITEADVQELEQEKERAIAPLLGYVNREDKLLKYYKDGMLLTKLKLGRCGKKLGEVENMSARARVGANETMDQGLLAQQITTLTKQQEELKEVQGMLQKVAFRTAEAEISDRYEAAQTNADHLLKREAQADEALKEAADQLSKMLSGDNQKKIETQLNSLMQKTAEIRTAEAADEVGNIIRSIKKKMGGNSDDKAFQNLDKYAESMGVPLQPDKKMMKLARASLEVTGDESELRKAPHGTRHKISALHKAVEATLVGLSDTGKQVIMKDWYHALANFNKLYEAQGQHGHRHAHF